VPRGEIRFGCRLHSGLHAAAEYDRDAEQDYRQPPYRHLVSLSRSPHSGRTRCFHKAINRKNHAIATVSGVSTVTFLCPVAGMPQCNQAPGPQNDIGAKTLRPGLPSLRLYCETALNLSQMSQEHTICRAIPPYWLTRLSTWERRKRKDLEPDYECESNGAEARLRRTIPQP